MQNQAASGHVAIRQFSSKFRAVGSTAAVDARDNASTRHSSADRGVPIYWLGGAKLADDYQDFYDGSWDDERNPKNQRGQGRSARWTWTGSDHQGTEYSANNTGALGRGEWVAYGQLNGGACGPGPRIKSGVTIGRVRDGRRERTAIRVPIRRMGR